MFEEDRSASILFVFDTNFQLSLYDYKLAFIKDLTIIPSSFATKKIEKNEYISNIQNASNLCMLSYPSKKKKKNLQVLYYSLRLGFSFTKPFGRNDNKRNVLVVLGGRSNSLQMLQLTFCYPSTNPTVTQLEKIDLALNEKQKDGKFREVVSLCWKSIKTVQTQGIIN